MIHEPIKDVKVGKTTKQYWDSRECAICQAVDENGKSARLKVDKYSITHTEDETKQYLKGLGVELRPGVYKKHFRSHSHYLEDAKNMVFEAVNKFALSRVDKLAQEFIDADEVIQDIITEGGNKIKRGDMPVNDRLLIAALKEQGARRKVGTLQQMFSEIDKQRFIVGEIVDEKEEVPQLESQVI